MAAASACDDVQRRAAARPQIIDVGDDDESDYDFDELDPEEEDELNNIVLLASEAGASSLTLSTDGDSILGMPSAFESKDEANKMSLFEMVVANSALQFEPAMLRPNQYPANHGGKPAERTERHHRQMIREKQMEADCCFKISDFFSPVVHVSQGKILILYICLLHIYDIYMCVCIYFVTHMYVYKCTCRASDRKQAGQGSWGTRLI